MRQVKAVNFGKDGYIRYEVEDGKETFVLCDEELDRKTLQDLVAWINTEVLCKQTDVPATRTVPTVKNDATASWTTGLSSARTGQKSTKSLEERTATTTAVLKRITELPPMGDGEIEVFDRAPKS